MKPTSSLTILLSSLALALPSALAADSEDANAKATAATPAAPQTEAPGGETPAPDAAAADEAFDVEVKLTGNDTMQYDKKAFTVETGQRVKLVFENIGKLPKVAMGHNLVILNKGVNKVAFATAAITAGPAGDYLPKGKESEMLAHTKILGPGESETIYFTAPDAGNYDYICTFPGHFALMNGVMTVK